MNIQRQGSNLFMGNGSIFQNTGLKSTQEKLQRQAACNNQVAFLEKQKDNLKNMESDSLEDISRKLDLLHSYEDQIAAVRAAYNSSQMFHVMDEARERGEQIAEAAEKYAPKTPEERREELVEEALGTDESKGGLTESLEELTGLAEEMTEELAESTEEMTEELAESTEEMTEELAESTEEMTGELAESTEEMTGELAESTEGMTGDLTGRTGEVAGELSGLSERSVIFSDEEKAGSLNGIYKRVDIRI